MTETNVIGHRVSSVLVVTNPASGLVYDDHGGNPGSAVNPWGLRLVALAKAQRRKSVVVLRKPVRQPIATPYAVARAMDSLFIILHLSFFTYHSSLIILHSSLIYHADSAEMPPRMAS
jgi:hypothetical protein